MSKLRLVFVKEHQASYISHLDVMRTFQRVFPRAGLSIKHSNGFHPHPILSIVLPLPVGQSSECEILDFESVEESTGEGVAEALNTGMPAGLRVLDCYGVTRPVREMVNLRAQLEMEYDNGVPEGFPASGAGRRTATACCCPAAGTWNPGVTARKTQPAGIWSRNGTRWNWSCWRILRPLASRSWVYAGECRPSMCFSAAIWCRTGRGTAP